jgi:hypothetical protein
MQVPGAFKRMCILSGPYEGCFCVAEVSKLCCSGFIAVDCHTAFATLSCRRCTTRLIAAAKGVVCLTGG